MPKIKKGYDVPRAIFIVSMIVLYGIFIGAIGYILTRTEPIRLKPIAPPIVENKCEQKVKVDLACSKTGFEFDLNQKKCVTINGAGCIDKLPFGSLNECQNACEAETEVKPVTIGEEFLITLDSNPSTGYSWEADFDENYLMFKSKDFVPGKVNSEVVGAGGKEIFTFAPINAGETMVTMSYGRSWESKATEVKVFKYNITKNRGVVISTDKAEYLKGEEVKINIKNNSAEEVFLAFPSIEVFEPVDGNIGGGEWRSIRTVWAGCGGSGGLLYLPLSAGESYAYSWDQKEKWCTAEKLRDAETNYQEARIGKYRVKSGLAKRTKSAEEDPNNISGRLADGSFYSNEFTIKDKAVIDPICSQKVAGIGLCKMIYEGYEFNESENKCVRNTASGCSFEIPFSSIEECQKTCETEIDYYSCDVDSDCVSVKEDCCGCNAGGKAISINKKYQSEWNNGLNCAGIMCPAVMSNDPTCSSKPKCENNKCIFGSSNDPADPCDIKKEGDWSGMSGIFSENGTEFAGAKSACEERSDCIWKNLGGKIESHFACCPSDFQDLMPIENPKVYERCGLRID